MSITRETIAEIPLELCPVRDSILKVWDENPTIGQILGQAAMNKILDMVLGPYTKKDYFIGLVCPPDKKPKAVAEADDFHDLIEKMLEANPHGWPQFIVNGMAIARNDMSPSTAMSNWMIANEIDPLREGKEPLIAVLYEIEVKSHEEMVRRGSPFKTCPPFNKFRAGALKAYSF